MCAEVLPQSEPDIDSNAVKKARRLRNMAETEAEADGGAAAQLVRTGS